MMKPGVRLLLVALVMGVAYQVVQWPEIRPLYSAEDKWAHGLAFFTVWWALRWALAWRSISLALLSAALGGAVEIHQIFLPGFTPSWADWAADLVGIALAVALFAWGSRRKGGIAAT